MRRLRILITLFALAVFAVFGFNRVREYITSDYVSPVISADQDQILASVSVTDEELLTGMSARDNLDGDVSDSLFVVSKSKFISTGTRRVSYAAFDKNNNVGVYSRELTYTDYVSPRFRLLQPLCFMEGNSNNDYLKNVMAYDCLDGNLTSQVRFTLGDTSGISDTISRRVMDLQVTNSAGDTSSLELYVTIKDYNSYYLQAPALTEYLVYTKAGEKPNYSALLDGVISGDRTRNFSDTSFDPTTDISISDSEVNYSVPGVYYASYQLSRELRDGTREALGKTDLVVVVEG